MWTPSCSDTTVENSSTAVRRLARVVFCPKRRESRGRTRGTQMNTDTVTPPPKPHRARWAAIGAAVAVSLGAGGLGIVQATEPDGATAYVPIEPCRLVEHVESCVGAWEVVAERLGLPAVPAGAESELEPAARDVVDRDRRLGQESGVAVADVEDETPDSGVGGVGGEGGSRGDRLVVGERAARRWRLVEVVPHRDPVEAGVVEASPQRT